MAQYSLVIYGYRGRLICKANGSATRLCKLCGVPSFRQPYSDKCSIKRPLLATRLEALLWATDQARYSLKISCAEEPNPNRKPSSVSPG